MYLYLIIIDYFTIICHGYFGRIAKVKFMTIRRQLLLTQLSSYRQIKITTTSAVSYAKFIITLYLIIITTVHRAPVPRNLLPDFNYKTVVVIPPPPT